MSDNKEKKDGRDRSRVSGEEDYEIGYLADKLNVSREEVRNAIEKIGNDRSKLEEFLKRK